MKSKNKNLFLKIYILFVIIISIALIILQILGSKNRVGYLTDFKLNVAKTLELNNIENINNKLDEEGLKNFILNNENITNYIYQFRIRYYDKNFRNNDIYGVYPDLSNLPDYIKLARIDKNNITMELTDYVKYFKVNKDKIYKNASSFGTLVSDKIINYIETVNITYTLKLNIRFIMYFYIIIISLLFIQFYKTVVKFCKIYLLKISIIIIILVLSLIIVFQVLGYKNRVGYLTEFNLNIDRTLELNNLNDIRKDFIVDGKLDEESIKNYLLTNENITNYIYHFRIRYYDKTFRNNDIYGVYPDLSNLPDYMENAEMDGDGSPYGNFISDKREINNEEKIDNISYILRVKSIIIIMSVIIIIIVLLFNLLSLLLKNNLVFQSKIILFVLYIFYILFGIIHHEPWRDEGQAWLIARDLSFLDIFLNTGWEGHPFLFHFIIKPFTFLPFYPTLHIINAIFVVIAVYILLFKNILNNFLFNAVLILNSMLMYEYPIVARNYGLAFMLFVYIMYIYKYRYIKTTNYIIALGLLMNTTVIGSSIGFIESAFFLWRIFASASGNFLRKKIKDLIILWAFLLIILFQLLLMIYRRSGYLAKLNINSDKDFYIFALLVILFFTIIFLVSIILKLNKNIKLFRLNYFVQFLIKIILIYFFIFSIKHFYGLSNRNTFLFVIYSIFILAIYINKTNYFHLAILNLSFLIILILYPFGFNAYIDDIKNNFSGCKDAAKYIKDNGFDNKDKYIIIAKNQFYLSASISPYFKDKIVYDIRICEYITFCDWSRVSKDYNTNL